LEGNVSPKRCLDKTLPVGYAPSTPATMSKQQATLSKQHSTLLPKTATMSNEYVAEIGKIVAKNGNNVEAAFDFVEGIAQLVAFDNE